MNNLQNINNGMQIYNETNILNADYLFVYNVNYYDSINIDIEMNMSNGEVQYSNNYGSPLEQNTQQNNFLTNNHEEHQQI